MRRVSVPRVSQCLRLCSQSGLDEGSRCVTRIPGPFQRSQCFANICGPGVRQTSISFSSSIKLQTTSESIDEPNERQRPDEQRLRLGNTVRTLHERLPTLLASPLPAEILSPQISLHLFPSTHPHLPTVKGRIPYTAALWTAPVAWGRVPVVGNIRLIILSERMIKSGVATFPSEKLLVRWKTCGNPKGRGVSALYRGLSGSGAQIERIAEYLGGDAKHDGGFTGLFIFEFDKEGRVASHTIEHAEEGRNWEKTTKLASVTNWLIGKAKGANDEAHPGYALGYCHSEDHGGRQDRNSR